MKKTTTTIYEKVIESIEEHPDGDFEGARVSNKRAKKMPRIKSEKEAKVDFEALSRRVRGMSVQPGEEEDSGDEIARRIESHLVGKPSDDEMQDGATKVKTEQEVIDEAWAAFDAAVAEDPSLMPKPEPRIVENIKMPVSRKRKRDVADDLSKLAISRARFVVNLDVCFDVSSLSKYLRSQNMHYDIDARDATTIKNLFGTLWLENHEWLIHEGYSLERVQRVKRLGITLLIKEGISVKNTYCWSIKGNFNGQEQREAWKQFLEAAETWGRGEALDQLRMIEKQERTKRSRCVKDHLGNFYDSNGDYWRPKKQLVYAQVDAEIVLHFD